LKEFCRRFAERAFRRPLTDDEKRLFIDRQFETDSNPDTAVKRSVHPRPEVAAIPLPRCEVRVTMLTG